MSKLFPIALMGKGSRDVESFPSYIHRLAFEHGVYVGQLITYVCEHSLGQSRECDNLAAPKYTRPEELVRPDRTTRMLVDRFEEMTGEKLTQSVLSFLNGPLGTSNGEIVKGFRWCPECIVEMEAFGCPVYFKLIWHLKSIKMCPDHRVPLISGCSTCGDSQKGYMKIPLGSCQVCGASLSKRQHKLKRSDFFNSWEDIGWDVLQFLEELAENPELVEGGLIKSLDDIYDYYWARDLEDELYKLISKQELLGVICHGRKLSLLSVRRIAVGLGVSLHALLSGNAKNTTEFRVSGLNG